MDMSRFLPVADEKPLDRIVDDGGYTAIFRTIACVGDSLASGEMESQNEDGVKGFHDMYEYSWGQYMARAAGTKVYNFSRGGMTAIEYLDSFAEKKGFWSPALAAQAYIVALGVNDKARIEKYPDGWGSIEDVADDYRENKKSFYGCYATIIQRYQEIQPQAKFFLVTRPNNPDYRESALEHAVAMREIAERLDNCFVIDLFEYSAVTDAEFRQFFNLGGHMNAMGYFFASKVIMSYIDYIIRHNHKEFLQVPFIGTGLKNVTNYPYKKE